MHIAEFSRGDRAITVISGERWNASGRFGRGEVARILWRPDGRHELSGPYCMVKD